MERSAFLFKVNLYAWNHHGFGIQLSSQSVPTTSARAPLHVPHQLNLEKMPMLHLGYHYYISQTSVLLIVPSLPEPSGTLFGASLRKHLSLLPPSSRDGAVVKKRLTDEAACTKFLETAA